MDYMEQALSLARLASGLVSPNPAVGALVVRDGVIVGKGYTQPPGSHHAEIMALNQAGDKARGSQLYVTLEPCCHYGRTPPCTKAIVDAGISEVHLATLDVNPLISGKGRNELKREGIKVYLGEYQNEAIDINEAYAKFITEGVPFVTVKFAMSLDGKIASKRGDSRWITGKEARKRVHNLRYTTDAIMVGVNTILADDPLLTVRCCGGMGGTVRKNPLRVIVDSNGRTPATARLFNETGEILLAHGDGPLSLRKEDVAQADTKFLALPSKNGLVSLEKLLEILGKKEISSILVEGGATLLGSLFDNKLVDKVVAFIAPLIIGGMEAKTAVGGHGVEKVADSFRLNRVKVEQLGNDLMVSGYIED